MKARQIERDLSHFSTTSNDAVALQLMAECADIAYIEVLLLEKDEIKKSLKITFLTDVDIALKNLHFLPVIEGEIHVDVADSVSVKSSEAKDVSNVKLRELKDGEALYRLRFEFVAPIYNIQDLSNDKFAGMQTKFVLPESIGDSEELLIEIVGVESLRRTLGGTSFSGICAVIGKPKENLPLFLAGYSLNPEKDKPTLVLTRSGFSLSRVQEEPRWLKES